MRVLSPFFLVAHLLAAPTVSAAAPSGCSVATASPWIERWLDAWELTSKEILKLPKAAAPNIVFFDSACVYTTSEVTARGAAAGDGPKLYGAKLPWRAIAHGDSLTLPDSSTARLALMSFTNVDRQTGPFFVMSAPSYWAQKGHGPEDDPGLAAVFIHEFAHTRQVAGMGQVIGPIDSTWSYPEELNDDAVQTHFSSDSVYVAAYLAERDLLYRAAGAKTQDEVRALAKEALAMIKARHARWFTGDKDEFAILDDTFLSMEGAAQWAAVAWLSHPQGGRLTKEAAVAKMLGRRRWWAQDESLALFLVVDRLMPDWPQRVFNSPSLGAVALLERAVR
jgi:hypothetical protein